MNKPSLFTLLVSVLVAFGAPAAFAGATNVSVCHIPPGDPDNFHTITIGENALAAHLAHGDVAGPCDQACATLCNDGNACTVDDTGDCEQNGCPVTHPAVDCNDGNDCTTDSCEPASGCVNTVSIGELCDDGQTCTGVDTCNAQGECTGPSIDNCCLTGDDCSQEPCDNATCDQTTNRCENNTTICEPTDACHVNVCDPMSGNCTQTEVTCGSDEVCDPATGACVTAVACPCWTPALASRIAAAPDHFCFVDSGDLIAYAEENESFMYMTTSNLEFGETVCESFDPTTNQFTSLFIQNSLEVVTACYSQLQAICAPQ